MTGDIGWHVIVSQSSPGLPPGETWSVSGRGRDEDTGWETSFKMTRRQALGLIFILIFTKEPWTVDPLTMGFGKNLYLPENRDGFSGRAFDFNIFPSSGDHFEDPFVRPAVQKRFHHPHHFSPQHVGPQHFLEIDLKFAKKKPIPGVRHLFCSGYYCAFEYASWEQRLLRLLLSAKSESRKQSWGCRARSRDIKCRVFRILTLCYNMCYH